MPPSPGARGTRKLWVDKKLFAKSGKLLKRVTLNNFQEIDGRWYPMHLTFKDELKTGKGTEFVVDSIEFNVPIPEHIFSKGSLRR